MSTPKKPADHYPSAAAMLELGELLKQPPTAERANRAWRVVTAAAGNADFHAVLDFALENELVAGCDATDPRAATPTWTNPADGSEMVWIPGGKFVYGTDDTPAECPGFSLGRYPVTNEQFARFLTETKYVPPADHPHPDHQGLVAHWAKGRPPKGLEQHPVVNVSLLDALAYCRWAGLTLPTEHLWEKAARGPDGRHYPWGGTATDAARRATRGALTGTRTKAPKLAHLAAKGTAAVTEYANVRSPYGCQQLVGNVSEWTLPVPDGYRVGQFPPPWPELPVPAADEPVHGVVRGACFLRGSRAAMRSTYRRRLSATRRNYWTGFRVAALLPCRPAAEEEKT